MGEWDCEKGVSKVSGSNMGHQWDGGEEAVRIRDNGVGGYGGRRTLQRSWTRWNIPLGF